MYDKAFESLDKLLIKLINCEREIAVNRVSIQDNLTIMENKGLYDFIFSDLVLNIKNVLKLDSCSLNNVLKKYTMKEANIYSNVLIILEKFKNVKKNIVDKFNYIDSFVGNITCY